MDSTGNLSHEHLIKEVSLSLAKRNGLLEKAKQLESELNHLQHNKSDTHHSSSPDQKNLKYKALGNSVSPKRSTTPRRRSDPKARGGVRQGPSSSGSGTGGGSMDSFDAHIKSIITNALMADQTEKSRAERSSHVSPKDLKAADSKAKPSLPVHIPLKTMQSLNVSIPLKGLDVHTKHEKQPSGKVEDTTRETYSPISRPSSSSSTLSADSVKNLPNGAADGPLSPPFQAEHPLPKKPHDQMMMASRLHPGSYAPYLLNDAHQMDSAMNQLIQERFEREKVYSQMNGSSPLLKASSQSNMTIPKTHHSLSDEKSRRGRRKRNISDGRSPGAVKRQAVSGRVASEVEAMVSAASQPLAISAISDAESSTKSSPGLQTSPVKAPTHMSVDGKFLYIFYPLFIHLSQQSNIPW